MSRRTQENLIALAFLAVFIGVIVMSLGYGPRARMIPLPLASFGVILILGGLRFATLEVEIYRQAVTLFDLPTAALLSLIQMLCTFVVMAFYTRAQARASLPLEQRPQGTTARAPRITPHGGGLRHGPTLLLVGRASPGLTWW